MTDVVLQDSSLSFLYLTCATWRRTSSLDRDMLLCKDSTLTDFLPNNDICSAVGAQPEWRKSQQTAGSRRGNRRWQCKFSLVFKETVSANKIWMTMISMNRFNWGHMTLGYWKFENYPVDNSRSLIASIWSPRVAGVVLDVALDIATNSRFWFVMRAKHRLWWVREPGV
jgi:hypothetical protein